MMSKTIEIHGEKIDVESLPKPLRDLIGFYNKMLEDHIGIQYQLNVLATAIFTIKAQIDRDAAEHFKKLDELTNPLDRG